MWADFYSRGSASNQTRVTNKEIVAEAPIAYREAA
jgi:hypothetical protein